MGEEDGLRENEGVIVGAGEEGKEKVGWPSEGEGEEKKKREKVGEAAGGLREKANKTTTLETVAGDLLKVRQPNGAAVVINQDIRMVEDFFA